MEYTDRFVTDYFAGKPDIPYTCRKLLPEELDGMLSRKCFHGDLILLDIRMQWKDGIALAGQINQASPRCQIIFLTGYIDYATMVYETRHLYFVLKPQMDPMLPRAMDKALAFLRVEAPGLLVSPQFKIPFHKILYLEKDQHDTQVHTEIRDFKVPKIVSFLFVFSVDTLIGRIQAQESLMELQKKRQQELAYYRKVQENLDHMRTMKHDFANQLQTVHALLKSGAEKERIVEFLDSVSGEMPES